MKVLILCSIGTPENSTLPAVKKYLQCFLGDKRVVSIPQPFRYLLTRGIIIPHKIKHSQTRYQRLASLFDGEMPLRLYLNQLKKRLQNQTDEWCIFSFMQYCGEDFKRLIEQVKAEKRWNKSFSYPSSHIKHSAPTMLRWVHCRNFSLVNFHKHRFT